MENIRDSLQTQRQPSSTRVFTSATCKACGVAGPECGFYRNERMRSGHISTCVSCHTERTIRQRKDRRDPSYVDGRKTRPKMSEEERLQRSRDKSLRYYHSNLNVCREKGRDCARVRHAADPSLKRRAMLKTKYSLTPEQWQEMFEAQGCKCAICGSDKPNAKAGWNTDHCHKTGLVRFILCAHCNRGLGAFRDNTGWMRKAADMLDAINVKDEGNGKYQGQPDRPVEAIDS